MKNYKYPRTPHLEFSPGKSPDDVVLQADFKETRVIVTEKLDGECSCLTRETSYARSTNSRDHPSRHWLKSFRASFGHLIPEGWFVFGENLYAFHSIFYGNLPTYFFVFGVYDDLQNCLSWEDTVVFCENLGLTTVPVIFNGVWEGKQTHNKIWTGKSVFETFEDKDQLQKTSAEGYVVRKFESFNYLDFGKNVCKYVRENHIKTNQHWMKSEVIPNKTLEKSHW